MFDYLMEARWSSSEAKEGQRNSFALPCQLEPRRANRCAPPITAGDLEENFDFVKPGYYTTETSLPGTGGEEIEKALIVTFAMLSLRVFVIPE